MDERRTKNETEFIHDQEDNINGFRQKKFLTRYEINVVLRAIAAVMSEQAMTKKT